MINDIGVDDLILYIESGEWVDFSCGRSTDYVNEFWEEGSKDNLIKAIKRLSKPVGKTNIKEE